MKSDLCGGRETGELRVVLYSHDSVGLGHIRRNLAIAHALSEQPPSRRHRQITGLLVTGEATATGFARPAGWDWVVLPGIRKHDGRYAPRHLGVGMDKLTSLRAAVIEATLVRFDPHLIIVDRHAFGVDGELVEALDFVRAAKPRCRVVLGLREVLDDPRTAVREWAALGDLEHIRRTFDEIWVYGDPAVHDPLATGEIPPELADKVRFSGYLAHGRPCRPGAARHPKPYLLTMVGGGSDGFELTMAAARAKVPKGHRHLIITGPQMPAADRRKVEQAARKRTEVIGAVPDALAEIRDAAAIVTMGGYNSICEVLSTSTPALVVPRVRPRREQAIRADALSALGLVDTCAPRDLDPAVLGDWFARVVGTSVHRRRIDLDGLSGVASLATDLLARDANAEPFDHYTKEYQNVAG